MTSSARPVEFDPATLVDAFRTRLRAGGGVDRAAVERLTLLALAEVEGAASALFSGIVEPLCDGFTPEGVRDYEEAFSMVIDLARRHPSCRPLDRAMTELGLGSARALSPAITTPIEPVAAPRELERVVVLSRVTLGADIAVVRPVLNRIAEACPEAETVLVGPASSAVALRGLPRARLVPIAYGRGGGLAARLNAWANLTAVLRTLTADLSTEAWVVLDPDSRLTQLGLLVPVAPRRYRRFSSRTDGGEGGDRLGDLADRWAARLLGSGRAGDSPLACEPGAAAWALALRETLGRPLVSVSFGVGGNEAKRVGPDFERGLLLWLVRTGRRVLLSRGASPDEIAATLDLCASLERAGARVRHLLDGRTPSPGSADLVTWQGDTDAFVAAIACADLYVGYDSAGQHIAAALGVPVASAFVEANGARHADRWMPGGRGPVRAVRLTSGTSEATALAAMRPAIDTLLPDRIGAATPGVVHDSPRQRSQAERSRSAP